MGIFQPKDEDRIKAVLEDLRPYLNMDGGDIEFVKYDEDEKIVYVKMYGACAMCMMQDDTLESGILASIQEIVPEVKTVINVPL